MRTLTFILIISATTLTSYGQFTVKDSGRFAPANGGQNKKVLLLQNGSNKQLILFKTNLQVNTDGTPTSYHPYDLRGDSIALNTILNGVAIYRTSNNIRISNPKKPNNFTQAQRNEMAREAYNVFERYRDSNFDSIPQGYRISWQSVLIPLNNKPCIFNEGKYKGYFSSATSLKNNLAEKGECEYKNQVDPLEIPTLVLAGGNHIVKTFGASMGDLLVAYNPDNKNIVYAIIGDSGPAHNLGEGSIKLNMQLLGVTNVPKIRRETYRLATKNNILIGIIPKSSSYKIQRPYSATNIRERIEDWFKAQGYSNQQQIKDFFENNKRRFN